MLKKTQDMHTLRARSARRPLFARVIKNTVCVCVLITAYYKDVRVGGVG